MLLSRSILAMTLLVEFNRHQSYLPHSPWQQSLSAILAATISLVFLALLNRDFAPTIMHSVASNPKSILLILLPKPRTPSQSPPKFLPSPKLTTAVIRNKPTRVAKSKDTTDTTTELNASPTVSSAKAETELINVFPDSANTAATSTTSTTDARFKYDSKAIRQAYEASKTDLQKMAEKNGTLLGDPQLNKHDKFQRAAERAVKPDCLRQGGTILSLVVVAYQLATDHCK